MNKMIIAALVLLVAQIGLSLALNISNKGIGAGTPDMLFLSFSPDKVQSIEITDAEGRKLVLEKGQEGWILPAHFSAPVDGNKVKTLLGKLAKMKQGFVVATSADAAKRFKVDGDSFVNHVVLKGSDQPLADFYVGTSPVFRQVHARRGDSNAIVSIQLSSPELENTPDKWLDSSFVTVKDEDLIGLNIKDVKLKKEAGGWQLEGLQKGEKINQTELDSLVTKARGLTVLDVLDPAQVSGLFSEPGFRFTAVTKGGKEVEYLFAKGEDDFYVLKISDRDFYFKVPSLAAETFQNVTRDKLIENGALVGENVTSPEEK
jgi:hypothetical protein